MIAWFIVPYKRRDIFHRRVRYCAMDDFTTQINSDGGRWAESEILGNRAIVKVRASSSTIALIAETFLKIPLSSLDDSLSSLTTNQNNVIKNQMIESGYSLAEIKSRFESGLSLFTLRDLLRFMSSRRQKPRYDVQKNEIICDGISIGCRDIDSVDREVS